MPRIKYSANVTESSGYAEAARNQVAAMLSRDADVSIELLRFEGRETSLDARMERLLRPHIGRQNRHEVKVVHANPGSFADHREPGIRNIGCTVWETDRLPRQWVDACNAMDEIWVPCQWNVDVFQASGVTVPVRRVPHALDIDRLSTPAEPLGVRGLPQDAYLFYSIFQWTPRKNPEGLVKAYLSEFTPDDNVCLLLKTYIAAHSSDERRDLAGRIATLKRDMGMEGERTPPIALLVANLGRDEMPALHRLGDCLVLPHRAEGWGIPLTEAMAMGKPVISTAFGGNMDFMTDQNSYPLDYRPTPACGMPWVPYRGDQSWAEPDLGHLKQLMRRVHVEREDAGRRGTQAAADLRRYSWELAGAQMLQLLESNAPPPSLI